MGSCLGRERGSRFQIESAVGSRRRRAGLTRSGHGWAKWTVFGRVFTAYRAHVGAVRPLSDEWARFEVNRAAAMLAVLGVRPTAPTLGKLGTVPANGLPCGPVFTANRAHIAAVCPLCDEWARCSRRGRGPARRSSDRAHFGGTGHGPANWAGFGRVFTVYRARFCAVCPLSDEWARFEVKWAHPHCAAVPRKPNPRRAHPPERSGRRRRAWPPRTPRDRRDRTCPQPIEHQVHPELQAVPKASSRPVAHPAL
jgi:hypothetical protein